MGFGNVNLQRNGQFVREFAHKLPFYGFVCGRRPRRVPNGKLIIPTHYLTPHRHGLLHSRPCLSSLLALEEAGPRMMDEGLTVDVVQRRLTPSTTDLFWRRLNPSLLAIPSCSGWHTTSLDRPREYSSALNHYKSYSQSHHGPW